MGAGVRFLAVSVLAVSAAAAPVAGPAGRPEAPATARRIAVRLGPGLSVAGGLERLAAWGRREGVLVEVAGEGSPIPQGAEALWLLRVPPPAAVRARLAAFPVVWEGRRFRFDGRAFEEDADAIALHDPRGPSETFVLGNSDGAVSRLALRALFHGEDGRPDYEILSGELSRRGRFLAAGSALSIARAEDADEIGWKDEFLRSRKTLDRGGVVWIVRDADRGALDRLEPVLRRFTAAGPAPGLTVRVFPDAAAKARLTGSSRPADVSADRERVCVDVDASAPPDPDLLTPALASAALAARDRRLLDRPFLLAALGARAVGSWWGRSVTAFPAFLRAAGVAPSVAEVLRSDTEVSPVFAVGAAAGWLEVGVRAEGEPRVVRLVAGGGRDLEAALTRWGSEAARGRPAPPVRRPLPAGFLRGVSYAMANSLDGGYVSPRSRATLDRLRALSANSISVMPYGFSPDARKPAIGFVHRHARGETDEATLRAVTDAHALGMTALVKPQLWAGGGTFVGDIRMASERDWGAWFAGYRHFVVHHAVVAEAAGADLFCVGTELVATEEHVREWREVIAAVRLATGAPLLYASNWAAGAERVPFWDALDAVGVDFYDPLSSDGAATDSALEAGARKAAQPLERLARDAGRPVVFVEAGYPPVAAAWLTPHDESSGRPLRPGDAARSVSAVFQAFAGARWWKGVYWWKAFSDGREARREERGFNFLGTPAGEAIAAGFRRLAGLEGERR